MHPFHAMTGGLVPVQVLVAVLGIATVAYWRVALRVILFVLVVLVAFGAVAFIDGFLHAIK